MAYRRILKVAAIHERKLDPQKFTRDASAKRIPDPATTATDSTTAVVASTEMAPTTHDPTPTSVEASTSATIPSSELLRPQELNAYSLWYHRNLSLDEMCAKLRSTDRPLARSTVMYDPNSRYRVMF